MDTSASIVEKNTGRTYPWVIYLKYCPWTVFSHYRFLITFIRIDNTVSSFLIVIKKHQSRLILHDLLMILLIRIWVKHLWFVIEQENFLWKCMTVDFLIILIINKIDREKKLNCLSINDVRLTENICDVDRTEWTWYI